MTKSQIRRRTIRFFVIGDSGFFGHSTFVIRISVAPAPSLREREVGGSRVSEPVALGCYQHSKAGPLSLKERAEVTEMTKSE